MKKIINEIIKMLLVIMVLSVGVFALVNVYEARVNSIDYNSRSIQIGK